MQMTITDQIIREMAANDKLDAQVFKSDELDDFIYHNTVGLSQSALKLFASDRNEYRLKYIDKVLKETETDTLLFGKMLHSFILTPDEFLARSFSDTSISDLSRNSKKYRTELNNLKLENEGKTFIKHETLNSLMQIHDLIKGNSLASTILYPETDTLRDTELSGFFKHFNMLLKCRFDFIDHDRKIIADLKSTSDASAFYYSALKYGYDWQQYWYQMAAKKIYGQDYDFVFIVVDKKMQHPEQVLVTQYSKDDLEYTGKAVNKALADHMTLMDQYNEGKTHVLGDPFCIQTMPLPEQKKRSYENL